MSRLALALSIVAWAGVRAGLCVETLQQPEQAVAPYRGVIVLREGGVLAGEIVQSGDRYLVRGEKSELNVPAASVAIVCHTLAEAYEHKRREIEKPTAVAHLALAEWCLESGLYPQAARELADARKLEPAHWKLGLLERRLAVLSEPPKRQLNDARAAATKTSNSMSKSAMQPEARSVADELSSEVVERFTRKVQPLVVNNCTATGCHRVGGRQSFQLDRALLYGMANRRSTQRNMAAVMALVDRERPAESKLLTIPRSDHGGMNRPIFGPRQDQQFLQLAGWVGMVARPTVKAASPVGQGLNGDSVGWQGEAPLAGAELSTKHRREPVTRVSYDADGELVVPAESPASEREKAAGADEPEEPAEFDSAVHADAFLPQLGSQPLRYGAQLQAWQPKDPFDPEIFNRQTTSAKTRALPSN